MKVLILCGGLSTRMGREKATLPLDGGTMVQRLVELFSPHWPCVLSIHPGQEHLKQLCPVIVDHYPAIGPMGGVVSALEEGIDDSLFVTGCDMPLISPALIGRMAARWKEESSCLLCRDRQGRLYPLGAIYSTRSLPTIQNCIAQRDYRLSRLAEAPTCQILSLEELGIDSEIFCNLNRPQEYEAFLKNRR